MRSTKENVYRRHSNTYRITTHARKQLEARWPQTVLPFEKFAEVTVPTDAMLVGYDGVTGASYVEVPGTPMVAVVAGEVLVTFLSADSASAKIALSGYSVADFQMPKQR